jgi:hypothetical protein
MRIYSYLFHAILAFFLFGVSLVALLNGRHNLKVALLPWEGRSLTFWMFFLGLAGFVAILLALRGKLRILFLIWSIGVVLVLIKGYIFSGYYFGGFWGFLNAVWFILAAILAAVGSWLRFRQPAERWT